MGIGLKSLITEFPEEGKYSVAMDKSNNFSALIILCLKEELIPQGGYYLHNCNLLGKDFPNAEEHQSVCLCQVPEQF